MIATSVIICLAAAGAAVTIGKSRLFAPLRAWPRDQYGVISRRDLATMPTRWRLLDALLHCPYCVAHWLTLIAVLAYQPRLVHSRVAAVDVLLSWLAITAVATAVAAVLCRAYVFEED